jgi:hypothetical protein
VDRSRLAKPPEPPAVTNQPKPSRQFRRQPSAKTAAGHIVAESASSDAESLEKNRSLGHLFSPNIRFGQCRALHLG